MSMTFTPLNLGGTLGGLQSATGMQTLEASTFEWLKSVFQRQAAYRQNPFWGNPETRRRYRSDLAKARESGEFSELRNLTDSMRKDQARYHWNIRFTEHFSKPVVHDAAFQDQTELREAWERAAQYAYYRAEDLYFLNEQFVKIEGYLQHARAEIAAVINRISEPERQQIALFQDYLTQKVENPLRKEQAKMAEAMLVRLQLVAEHRDLAFDDVIYHFSERFKAAGILQADTLAPRPYTMPTHGLKRSDFHHYHQHIQKYGNEAARTALQQLPWVSEGHYTFDTQKQTWRVNKNIIENADIPSARRKFLRWFFRGRNARYEALHDVTRYLEVQMHLKSTNVKRSQLAGAITDGLSEREFKQMLTSQRVLQQEQQRIRRLRNKLNAVFHGRAKSVLKSYLEKITDSIVKLVNLQKTILQKAQASLPSIINNEAKLDQVMRLLDQFENTIKLLPEDHALVQETRTVQAGLREQIARQKLDAFSLALEALPFQKRAVYDGTSLLYKVADREAVEAYFARITKYLAPEQAAALQLVAGILTGDHYREGRQINYEVIYSAMAQCFVDPDPVVRTVIRKVIAPSVYGANPHNPAYRLLLDCEGHLDSQRRSDILRDVVHYENGTLFIALNQALQTEAAFDRQTHISVDGRDMLAENFLARLSTLDVRALQRSAADYLARYAGDHEYHWEIFEVMPTDKAVVYAQQRLSYLLVQRNYQAIAESSCLLALQRAVKQESTHTNRILASFVSTITFTVNDIPGIDALVGRFANEDVKTVWQNRREQYLLDAFNARLHQPSTEGIGPLRAFLAQNQPFPSTTQGKENLALQIRYMPHAVWTTEHHALVDTIDNVDLRQQYQINLLRRVLANREFAEVHAGHLPAEEDALGNFELISAPNFKTICEAALAHFDQQERIDNVAGFRVLHGLLMHDLAFLSELGALQTHMQRLLERFKSQVNVTLEAEEIMSLVDAKHFDDAKTKLYRQKELLVYYQSRNDQNSYHEVVNAIKLIVEAMRMRLNQDVRQTALPALLSERALSLLENIPTEIPEVEQLQWALQNQTNLRLLATRLRTEIYAIRDSDATTLPSLSLFNDAVERGVLPDYLSEQGRQDLITSLRLVLENNADTAVPEPSRHILSSLLCLLRGEDVETNARILAQQDAQAAEADDAGSASSADTTATSEDGDANTDGPPPIGAPVELQAEASREFIAYFQFQRRASHVEMTTKLGQIFSATRFDDALKLAVSADLLRYFKYLCSLSQEGRKKTKESKALAAQAEKSANRMRLVLSGLNPQPEGDVFILTKKILGEIPSRPQQIVASLQALLLDGGGNVSRISELLDNYLLAILENALLLDDFRAGWVNFMEEKLIPAINGNKVQVSSQLSAALHSLCRVLKHEGSDEDHRNILAYQRHYRDVVSGAVQQTATVRMRAGTPPSVQQREESVPQPVEVLHV